MRPSKYKKEYDSIAYKLALLGHKDKEIASFFDVTEQTINNWKKDYPSFFEALKKGKEPADCKVVQSLYKRALGFKKKQKKAYKLKRVYFDERGKRVEEEYIAYADEEVYYPADVTAGIYWLNNRQKEYWKNRQETGFNQDNKLQRLLDAEDNRMLKDKVN